MKILLALCNLTVKLHERSGDYVEYILQKLVLKM